MPKVKYFTVEGEFTERPPCFFARYHRSYQIFGSSSANDVDKYSIIGQAPLKMAHLTWR